MKWNVSYRVFEITVMQHNYTLYYFTLQRIADDNFSSNTSFKKCIVLNNFKTKKANYFWHNFNVIVSYILELSKLKINFFLIIKIIKNIYIFQNKIQKVT